jgi:3-oxoadipate CoA-transferase, beta subunit
MAKSRLLGAEIAMSEGANWKPLGRDALAARLAQDIHEGWSVNLGIGIPTLVGNYVPAEREVVFHSENGILGMGPAPAPDQINRWLINASSQYVTLRPGASYMSHSDSFALVRGGHLDLCVLGAFQVSAQGDLANWHTGAPDAIPAVGGAMDLAIGARNVYVMMEHTTKSGEPKIVRRCTYPLTGLACVNRIYTDLAVIEVTPNGFRLVELSPGIDFDFVQERTAAPLLRTPERIKAC